MKKLNVIFLSILVSAVALSAKTPNELVGVLLSGANLEEKMDACRQLATVGTEKEVPVLAGLLGDKELSHMARYALEPIPSDSVDAALRKALGQVQGRQLIGVINSIGVREDSQALEQLVGLTKNPDGEVVQAACYSLARIGTPEAIKALTAMKGSQALNARLAAGSILLERAKRKAAVKIFQALESSKNPETIRCGALSGLLQAEPAKAAERIVKVIGKESGSMQRTAIAFIPKLQNGLDPIVAHLDDWNPLVQVAVIEALGRAKDASASQACFQALQNKDEDVRVAAIKALGTLQHTAATPSLCKLLDSAASGPEKQAAAETLAGLPGASVNAAIVAAMKAGSPEARIVCIGLLADRRAIHSVDALLVVAKSGDQRVQIAANKALAELAESKQLPALVELLAAEDDSAVRKSIEQLLITVARQSKNASAAVLKLLNTKPDVQLQCACLRVLGGIADPPALAALCKVMGDADKDVADTAVRELAKWPDERALRPLLKAIPAMGNRTHRILAVQGCARMLDTGTVPPAQAVNHYETLLKLADRPDEKKILLNGLGKQSSPKAVKLIESLVDDPALKAEAELALKQAKQAQQRAAAISNYITDWQVAGPYGLGSAGDASLFDAVLPPEKNEAQWKELPMDQADKNPWMFRLHKTVRRGGDQACYVRTAVQCKKPMKVKLNFATDDGNKVWLNGKLVHSYAEGGPATPGKHQVPVTLKKGWNLVMMKVTQISGTWQFCFRLTTPDGKPIRNLKTDPGQWPASKPAEPRKPVPPPTGPWTALFNGKNLDGWTETGEADFLIEDGCLVGTQNNGLGGDLWTEKEYDNFELRVTYKMVWPGNSGFWFRHNGKKGYQFDVLKHPKPIAFSGSFYCPGKLFLTINLKEELENRDGWNEARILALGNEFTMWLNGKQVSKATDDTFSKGKFGIQIHKGENFKGMKMIVKKMEIR